MHFLGPLVGGALAGLFQISYKHAIAHVRGEAEKMRMIAISDGKKVNTNSISTNKSGRGGDRDQ